MNDSGAETPPLEITGSSYFLNWLAEQNISLAFTTYQTCRLFLLGLKADGQLSAFERLFDRAMGLWATPEQIYLSTRYQLWRFDNVLTPDQTYEGYDKLYLPRTGHTTGDLDIHDVVIVDKIPLFVNTRYNCLATLSQQHSFKPFWQPPFISQLVPEDRCHLNGLALWEGQPRYVTAVSRSDVRNGWRDKRHNGGLVMDIQTNEILLAGLSMPHSPRFYRGRLWLLNSGRGEFGYVDLAAGTFEPVAFCPGYARGLAFWGDYAIIGLSKPREKTFTGLDLQDRLTAYHTEAQCGLIVVDLNSGHIVHWLRLEGVVTELYDVQVLPGVHRPMAFGFKTDEIARLITVEPGGPALVSPPLRPSALPYRQKANRAVATQTQEALAETLTACQQRLALDPDHLESLIEMAQLLQQLDRTEEALTALERAASIAPHSAKIQFKLAQAYKKTDQLETAVSHFRRAVYLQPDFIAGHNNLGTTLQELGYLDEAAACYQQVIKRNPNLAEPQANLAAVWLARGYLKRAEAGFQRALQLKPEYVPAQFNLAILYQRLGRMKPAGQALEQVLARKPDHPEAHFHLAQVYEIQGQTELASEHYAHAMQRNPTAPHYFFSEQANRFRLCDWTDYDRRLTDFLRRTKKLVQDESAPPLVPLNLSAVEAPLALHRAVNRHFARSVSRAVAQQRGFTPDQIKAGSLPPAFTHPQGDPPRLRIGYLSPDFRNHAVGRLIHHLFEHHDRSRVEIFSYALLGVEDDYTAAIKAGSDHFANLYGVPAAKAAKRIYQDGIHILVDLAGYTAYANADILAFKPAPLQAHFLGYPDTMGADFIDYALVDRWLVPPEIASHYVERPFYLPHAFVGSALAISDQPMSRAEFGLPQAGVVFCCFNAHHKIDPQVFTRWMNILKAVPGGILWLASAPDTVRQNLAREAEMRQVDPARLIYAARLPEAEYLARYRLADLFLDTFPYNAGSTAVAALYAGVPLLTRAGQTNSARMGASICAAAGLPETICHSTEDYEAKAIHLATHPRELAALRRQLADRRATAPLFDLPGFARSLEAAYQEMWLQHKREVA